MYIRIFIPHKDDYNQGDYLFQFPFSIFLCLAPSVPLNFALTETDQTALTFSWTKPTTSDGIIKYVIECSRKNDREIVFKEISDASSTGGKIDGLATYTSYRCHVSMFLQNHSIECKSLYKEN